ncbi:MAG: hypothetical protein A4E47_00747 [Methanosaeta sp. PtaU1.Bin028]|nr:MAG: hypothetical protein A4E47_00747 [Methanosaeta sp. PtaU1.Bin028]
MLQAFLPPIFSIADSSSCSLQIIFGTPDTDAVFGRLFFKLDIIVFQLRLSFW